MKPIKKVDVLSALLAKIWRIVTSRQHAEAFDGGRHVAILMAFNANIFARASRETVH